MAGLREQNKALRRTAILDAALSLLRHNHPSEVTTAQIADRAGLSAATVFNLVGTRDDLLVALAHRIVEDLVESLTRHHLDTDGDPIAAARLIVDESVATFTADSAAYRRVMAEIGFRHDLSHPDHLKPALLQEAAMREAQARGIIDTAFDPAGLGRQIFVSYSAAMMRWATRSISDEGFLVIARHGLTSVLAATANEPYRETYRAELAALSHQVGALR